MKKTALLFSILFVLNACDKPTDSVIKDDFDRKVMLQNYYDNLILPAFTALESSVLVFETSLKLLVANPTEQSLSDAQKAWEATYIVWLSANAYNFGPTGEDGIRKGLIEEIGTFPVNVAKIEANITTKKLTFNDFDRDNRGLLGIEYLLFDSDNKSALAKLKDQNRRNYLLALTENVKMWAIESKKGWVGYKADFTSKNGTDVGSSTSQLYNEFIRSYEAIKNFKMGLPLGLRAGQTQAEPSKVEGFYSKKSLKFLTANINAIENIYYGRGTVDGLGLKEYLEAVEGGKVLVASTEAQLAVIKTVLKTVPDNMPIAEQIVKSPQVLTNLHTELQKNTRFFKSDMSSILGIAITFASGDGD